MNARRLTVTLAVLLPVSLLTAVMVGAVSLPAGGVLRTLLGIGPGDDSQTAMIVEAIRLPRALLTALVGALLAICGAAMQGLFRNPLADPSLIGVTAGASVGASLMIVFSGTLAGIAGLSLISLGAFAGGAGAVALVYRLATGPGGTSVATMLLAGIAIAALAGSAGGLLEFYASNEMLRRISLWRMGGLEGANWLRVGIVGVIAALVLTLLPAQARALNALLLGESEARHLGIPVNAVKRRLILMTAAGVGVSVAVAGAITFVGLVVPHIVRMLIGPDHRWLLPASAMAGAVLLLWADILARTLVAPTELPVGLLTALLGAPFFISLLRHRHEYGMA
ncbi:iron ABC transporter permease [Spectribacter hydrogenoxidans]|uniref:Iron ABC transporter permease n=1 Tax=Spectribacter hydrogenoxidans TaxID=3075608 RepID=A0ABU3C1Z7_9GAMM|nr:iron ABC transporter permease [Salinisphaera sp. W335]MDT0635578.1 iron ABC transporter permease [Salinisphaera sp. W335]